MSEGFDLMQTWLQQNLRATAKTPPPDRPQTLEVVAPQGHTTVIL